MEKARKGKFWPWFLRVGIGGILICVCCLNFSVVRGGSMKPGLRDGDRILVDRLSYLFWSIERRDVVVFKDPFDPSVLYVKRAIGLPGDEIMIEGDEVWVNGKKLIEPYIAAPDPGYSLHVQVPRDHYFVLGDNRPLSYDSRDFGLVPRSCIVGLVW